MAKQPAKQSKWSPEIREALLGAASRGATNRDAAAMTGISESCLYAWLRDKEDFGEDYARARASGRYKSIKLIADSDDWRAHAWLLERVDPAHWGKAEITNDGLAQKLAAYMQGVTDGQATVEGVPVIDATATG